MALKNLLRLARAPAEVSIPADGAESRLDPRHDFIGRQAALRIGGTRFGIHLKNLSANGASGLTDAPLEAGQIVLVELSRTVSAPAEVRWTRRSIAGVAFLKPLSSDFLRRLHARFRAARRTPAKFPRVRR